MKLVKIANIRCGEYDSTQFVLAPDDWDWETINQKIQAAQDAYLAELESVKKDIEPPAPSWQPEYKNYPEMTVKDIEAEWRKQKQAYDDWFVSHAGAYNNFSWWLREEGFKDFWNEEYVEVFEADWGHRHGQRLDLVSDDMPDIGSKIPSPAQFGKPPLEADW